MQINFKCEISVEKLKEAQKSVEKVDFLNVKKVQNKR